MTKKGQGGYMMMGTMQGGLTGFEKVILVEFHSCLLTGGIIYRLSYRLLQGFAKWRRVGGGDLSAHSVGVAAAATGTGGAVVATLA